MDTTTNDLGPHINLRIKRAGEIALEQLRLADDLVVEAGVGGKHPDRERLVIAMAQVIATNYNALESKP